MIFKKSLSRSLLALAVGFVLLPVPGGFELSVRAETAPAFKTHVIDIRSSAFSRRTLTVSAGDTVIWVNRDIVPHTATGRAFDSGNLKSGASWKFVFTKKGNYPYICTYHPTMKGTIIVR